jgi:hypothetical protein
MRIEAIFIETGVSRRTLGEVGIFMNEADFFDPYERLLGRLFVYLEAL